MSLKRTKKTVALLTLFFFFSATFSYSAPPEPAAPPFRSFLTGLPRELGSVQTSNFSSFFNHPNSPFILHLQDAHSNPEAQLRIKEILTWLRQTTGASFRVGVEGAVGPLHPEYLEFFSDVPEANEVFIQDLLQKGELTGAEWFAWEEYKRSLPVAVSGVETAELYRENLKNFRDILFRRDEISTALELLRRRLEVAQSNLLSPELRAFVREKEKSREAFVPVLVRTAKKVLQIDLNDKIEQLRFPNLTRLVYLQGIESQGNPKAAEAEWQTIKSELKKETAARPWIDLLEGYWRTPSSDPGLLRSIFKGLFQSSPRLQDFSFGSYPHYLQWAKVKMISSEVNATGVFSEIERLSQAIQNRLSVTETDRKILTLQVDFKRFEKLNLLELTREEFLEIKEHKQNFTPQEILKRLKELNLPGKTDLAMGKNNPLFSIFDEAFHFYETAESRDRALLENALSLAPQNSNAPSIIVLITGGFHTQGLTHLMEERGISYAVVAPALVHPNEENLYHRVLRRENADLSAYFNHSTLNKQEALFLKGLIEKAVPELAKKKLSSAELVQRTQEVFNRHPLFKHLDTAVFPGKEQPFIRLTIHHEAVPAATNAQAVAEVANLIDRDRYPYLAAQSVSSPFPSSPLDLLAVDGRLEARRVETLAARAENRLTMVSGPITSDALAQLGLKQIQSIAQRGALGALDTPQMMMGSWPFTVRPENRDDAEELQIAVIGLSHTGVGTAAVLAKGGANVTAMGDKPTLDRVNAELKNPNLEPGLRTLAQKAQNDQHLRLVEKTDWALERAVTNNQVIYLDVGDPSGMEIPEYIEQLRKLAAEIGQLLKDLPSTDESYRLLIIRGTLPESTTSDIFKILKQVLSGNHFSIAYQPDYARTGTTVEDLLDQQLVIGLPDVKHPWDIDAQIPPEVKSLLEKLKRVYGKDIFVTSLEAAEFSKVALLSYLASTQTLINQLYPILWEYGGSLPDSAVIAGLDERIGLHLPGNLTMAMGGWLYAYIRFLIKAYDEKSPNENLDTDQLLKEFRKIEKTIKASRLRDVKYMDPKRLLSLWLRAILAGNELSIAYFQNKIKETFRKVHQTGLEGAEVSILGVAFKAGTDQITESPALKLVEWLVQQGVASIRIYDPLAVNNFKSWLAKKQGKPGSKFVTVHFEYPNDPLKAMSKVDLAIYGVPLEELKALPPAEIKSSLGNGLLVDGVNIYKTRGLDEKHSLKDIETAAINYLGFGRTPIGPAFSRTVRVESEFFPVDKPLPVDDTQKLRITVWGLGYVGSLMLALLGMHHNVIGFDINEQIVNQLSAEPGKRKLHIFETGLEKKLFEAVDSGRLKFTFDPEAAVLQSEAIVVAVNTPEGPDGEIILDQITSSFRTIGNVLRSKNLQARRRKPKLIVIKSTITPNVFKMVAEEIMLDEFGLVNGLDYDLSSNPEFFAEGQAIQNGTEPDRTVVAAYSSQDPAIAAVANPRVKRELLTLWAFLRKSYPHPVFFVDSTSATMGKYIANMLLAKDISLANLFAWFLVKVGTYYSWVVKILRNDSRISYIASLMAGCGFGGHCFGKDVEAAVNLSQYLFTQTLFLGKLINLYNEIFKRYFAFALAETMVGKDRAQGDGPLQGKTIGLAGLTFKKLTDDVREAPSLALAEEFLEMGARLVVYNPGFEDNPDMRDKVQSSFKTLFIERYVGRYMDRMDSESPAEREKAKARAEFFFTDNRIVFAFDLEEVFASHAVLIANEWDALANLLNRDDLSSLVESIIPMSDGQRLIVDARGVLDPEKLQKLIAGKLKHLDVRSLGPGRPALDLHSARQELRIASNDSTEKFTRNFLSLHFTRPAGVPLESIEAWYPGLRASRIANEGLDSYFYDASLFDEASQEAVLGFLQRVLAAGKTQDPILRKALEIARGALGEYAWLLDQEGTQPIHIAEPSALVPLQNPVGLLLALSGPQDQATVIAGPGADDLRKRIRGWPQLFSKVKVVGTDGATADSKETLHALRKLVTRAPGQELGTYHSERSFLESLNVQGIDRFLLDRPLDQETVFLMTAFLLRHQVADRDIVNLHEWMNQKGIDENDLVSHVAKMIQAVSLFLSQA